MEKSKFNTSRITALAKQVKSSEMVWPSSIDDSSLPVIADARQTFHVVRTYAQLGVDAVAKIFDMFLDAGTQVVFDEGRIDVALVDLTLASSLDFAKAMLLRPPFNQKHELDRVCRR